MQDERVRRLAAEIMRQNAQAQQEEQSQFRSFGASELYCPNCRRAMPVREKMLLVLSRGELYDYVCSRCGTSLGTKTT